jgi:hypothetical protein
MSGLLLDSSAKANQALRRRFLRGIALRRLLLNSQLRTRCTCSLVDVEFSSPILARAKADLLMRAGERRINGS